MKRKTLMILIAITLVAALLGTDQQREMLGEKAIMGGVLGLMLVAIAGGLTMWKRARNRRAASAEKERRAKLGY